MAMWPFRRKGSRRRSRIELSDKSNLELANRGRQDAAPQRTRTDPVSSIPTAEIRGDGSTRKLSRRYSFSPGRQDSLPVAKLRKKSAVHDAAPPSSENLAMRVPTLHHGNSKNKRSGQPLPRKKSSKRRKEDHDREAEIKAMSQFMPTRPATDKWTAGRPMKRESRYFRAGLGASADSPSSVISLPLPESIHSAMSTDSEGVSWRVSAFDALSPRPTLRYSSNPLTNPAAGSGPMHSQSVRRKNTAPLVGSEAPLQPNSRIRDLADELDASDLRELLERDKRRRARKLEKERERAERRLARRVEKQRAAEAEAARNGCPSPPNLDRGVLGRELPNTAGERTSAIVTSSRRRYSGDSERRSRQSGRMEEPANREKTPSPLDEFYGADSIPSPDHITTAEEAGSADAPQQLELVSSRPSSPRMFNLMRSKKPRSDSPTQLEQTAHTDIQAPRTGSIRLEDAESLARTSDSRSSRPWLSLFKWGRSRRGSGPSSFSNTSRDSMLGSQHNLPTNYMPPRKASSSVPKRTMSRFREDLPELPISPPDSRMASPEAEPIAADPLPAIPDDVVMRYDTPVDEQRNYETMRATPILIQRESAQPSPAPHSMSLASIDSEASWLSGRISRNRASSGMRTSLQHPPRTVSALSGRSEGQASECTEDGNIVDDEYLDSVVPTRLRRPSTGDARPSSDEEDESAPRWGAAPKHQTPTVVRRETMQSREGLLQSFDDEKESGNDNESEEDEDGQSPVEPQRARSVRLDRGHARNFSAGSAKLFEVSPRPSGEQRRSSTARGAQ
ncbi:hypothetical protein F5Y17DRAFT_77636 [Xylariaceae sp. FL0594]|nr:hypothetical protein F5Y17DRAFT_77636 [Xylariaceae sp. FL0594]